MVGPEYEARVPAVPSVIKQLFDLVTEGKDSGEVSKSEQKRVTIHLESGWSARIEWRVPERYSALIYKGACQLDLRAAELDGPVTTIFAVAYKSEIEIIVPPGVRVELGGFGTSGEVDGDPGPNAPIIVVRGFAHKGSIEARTSPSHP
ncbi:MAG: hypothetical protein JWN52_1547 [Actinomycetia bacterium]|nr:hypothetical protein [Actinomycetes bacterium]